jgi:hypothetical protein
MARVTAGEALLVEGPSPTFRLRVEATRITDDLGERLVIVTSPTRSTDTRHLLRVRRIWSRASSPIATLPCPRRLMKRQCGDAADNVIRVLVVDFSRRRCWLAGLHLLAEHRAQARRRRPAPGSVVSQSRTTWSCPRSSGSSAASVSRSGSADRLASTWTGFYRHQGWRGDAVATSSASPLAWWAGDPSSGPGACSDGTPLRLLRKVV